MREDGTSSTEIRQKLKKQGFKAPRISQLLKDSQHEGGRGTRAVLLAHIAAKSALTVLQELESFTGEPASVRMSCAYQSLSLSQICSS